MSFLASNAKRKKFMDIEIKKLKRFPAIIKRTRKFEKIGKDSLQK